MKYKIHFNKFIQHLDQRLKKGHHEYGDKSFDRPACELLDEIQEELVDVAGWAEILYSILEERKVKNKKIIIIGSTQYFDKIVEHQKKLEALGHIVLIPAFDDHKELDELGVCFHNRKKIKEADEVHVIWDQRSMGTIFDFGMAFALNKPIKIIYLEPKTFAGVMTKYEKWNGGNL